MRRFLLLVPAFMVLQCSRPSTTDRLMEFADGIRVVNTHTHQHWPEEYGDHDFGFMHLISPSYLISDIGSAGGKWLSWEELDSLSPEAYWDVNGKALDYCRATSYYSHFVRGFRELYGFGDLYFTESNIQALSEQVEANYADYRNWFDSAFHKAGFELMFLDQFWKLFNTEIDTEHFALVFNINPLVMYASERPSDEHSPYSIYAQAERDGFAITDFDSYLTYCSFLFGKNARAGAVCLKNSMAYQRSLEYEKVSYDEARVLFDRSAGTLTPAEAKKIQDYVFHWVIGKSIEYHLPIQIHTGYLAGNGNWLENGRPVKLNNLFLEYPEAKFILFHGGYPWTGEFAALGKMFPNVCLDLVWLPQISREEAVHALDEIFDAVPYNKIFWGGDCQLIEEETGSLVFGKEVVTEVLSKRIERGLLTEEVAEHMILRIFRENAIETFQLEALPRQ